MHEPSKVEVVAALAARLQGELDALFAVITMARDEATHGESRPENQYDTRATEASYLAAGQGQRLAELKQLKAWFDAVDPSRRCERVELGALVCLEDEDARVRRVYVAPSGGDAARVGGHDVRVISLASPLGRALAGLRAGDDAEVDGPGGSRTLFIQSVW